MQYKNKFEIVAHSSCRHKIWKLLKDHSNLSEKLATESGLPIFFGKLLLYYGITSQGEVEKFLSPTLKKDFPDPFIIKDMLKGVEIVIATIKSSELITILGDYDVDGVSGCAIIFDFLRVLGAKVDCFLPNRFTDGYGLSNSLVAKISSQTKLVITIDCGSTSLVQIEQLNKKGIRTLIIDHHQFAAPPKAAAIINPQRQDDKSGFTNLSASGLAFMFVVALKNKLKEDNDICLLKLPKQDCDNEKPQNFEDCQKDKLSLCEPEIFDYLGLCSLGLICDVMDMRGLTRLLVTFGLKLLSQNQIAGVKELLSFNNLQGKDLSSEDIGFILGPQINAAGRLAHPSAAFDVLTCRNKLQAPKLVKNLYLLNEERKIIDRKATKEAISDIKHNKQTNIIIAANKDWSKGVVGIIAGKIKEYYDLPTIIFSIEGDIAVGSARSIAGINIGRLIKMAVDEKIAQSGGGHAMAAGLTIQVNKINELRQFLAEKITSQSNLPYVQEVEIATKLSLGQVNHSILQLINKCGPFGSGIKKPLFLFENIFIKHWRLIKDLHYALTLSDHMGNQTKSMLFYAQEKGLEEVITSNHAEINVVANIESDNFYGQNKCQLIIEDINYI